MNPNSLGELEQMKFELETLDEYSDENLLTEIKRVVKELKGDRFTIDKFDKLAKVHSTTLRNHFGSLKRALDLAGIDEKVAPRFRVLSKDELLQVIREYITQNPGVPVKKQEIAERLGVDPGSISRRFGEWHHILAEVGGNPFARRYSEKECFENLFNLWTYYGRQPHFAELKKPPSTVGSKAYIQRWGGWRKALAAFIRMVNEDKNVFDVTEENSTESNTVLKSASQGQTRNISLSLRYKILIRDRCRCVLCGASPATELGVTLHIDHKHPWSKDGLTIEENLRTLCSKCNLGKGAKIEEIV
jgi:5-methylcytosine-specific restriction endonuclease McrA